MKFEIRAQHPLPEEIVRIWEEQLMLAIKDLSRQRQIHQGIHQARKSLKRARAIVRLVRDPLGQANYREANVCYRDAARKVSALRDLAAMMETLEKISQRYRGQAVLRGIEACRADLIRLQQVALKAFREDNLARAEAVATLQNGLATRPTWDQSDDSFAWISSSLQRVYRRGRRAMQRCEQDPDTHELHQWRKRVKYLCHQLQVLHLCWPQLLDPVAEEFHRLSDFLGDDHDLAVLNQMIEEEQLMAGRIPGKRQLQRSIEHYRHYLQSQLFPLGARLYQATPKTFTRQLHDYWEVWREEAPVKY